MSSRATATASNVNYAVQAKTALAAIERLNDEVEAAIARTREKWRDYGAALLGQRQQMDSDKEFGEWIAANGLDQGRVASRAVRADAMWLAENWTSVIRDYTGNRNDPQHIRQECRGAGFKWARETERQKERKAKSRRARSKKYSGFDVAAAEHALSSPKTGGSTDKFSKTIHKRWPEIQLHNPEHEQQLRSACRQLIAEREPEMVAPQIAEIRETLKETQRERFDKALKKATDLEIGRLRARFNVELQRELSKRVQSAIQEAELRARESFEDSQRILREFNAKTHGLKQAITRKDYQAVLSCVHPDHPERTAAQLAKAFHIVRQLQDYVDAFDK